jgi:hypothetical protein
VEYYLSLYNLFHWLNLLLIDGSSFIITAAILHVFLAKNIQLFRGVTNNYCLLIQRWLDQQCCSRPWYRSFFQGCKWAPFSCNCWCYWRIACWDSNGREAGCEEICAYIGFCYRLMLDYFFFVNLCFLVSTTQCGNVFGLFVRIAAVQILKFILRGSWLK